LQGRIQEFAKEGAVAAVPFISTSPLPWKQGP